ncbi:MAG: alanine--tRNA ligase [Chloroflexota bacterium]
MPPRPPLKTSDDVRRAWRQFFAERGHVAQPSSSLVPYNDPSVLLTTAGMQQMIPYMLGREEAPAARMTSIQKCFRTGDIDEVGNPRNCTFFEMLGNFSIGDYFKKEAIAWAWEFVTEWLQFPAERVYVTVHPTDDEAREHWRAVGLPADRLSDLDDNWWGPPGAEGPCGPDSELYFDRGPEFAGERPGDDGDRYLEFWNLVFMQYYQARDGSRTPLPRMNIDTGSGLERVTAILQDVPTVYETDLFKPIIDRVAEISGTSFGRDQRTDYALRVIADHARGMTFLAADGVVPGNEGRGYVMRRIVRRAIRYGRTIGIDRPFLVDIVRGVIERMGGGEDPPYEDLFQKRAGIVDTIQLEEGRFGETLAAGTERLAEWIDRARAHGLSTVDGRHLFQLHDTFGFPFELSEEILAESGLTADRAGFDTAMEEQRARSRQGASFRGVAETRAYAIGDVPATEFLGYELLDAEAHVLAMQAGEEPTSRLLEGQEGIVVLERTPFYAEGGGQVGDRGVLHGPDGTFEVRDTRRIDDRHIAHFGVVTAGSIAVSASARASVDRELRAGSARHHTITHILHRTLKDVLGEATEQKGSLVAPHVARFDFNYPRGLDRSQLDQINARLNRHVLENLPVAWQVMDIDSARRAGAVAIFGEKYGSQVRVVDIGGWSKELCGGIHVARSGDVGPAILVRESGLASGIRRVEVLAGEPAFAYTWAEHERLADVARRLGAPMDQIEAKLTQLQEELDQARREATRLGQQLAARRADQLTDAAVDVSGVKVLAVEVEAANRDGLRDLADQLRAKLGCSLVALAARLEGQTAVVVGVSKDAATRGLSANDVLRAALEVGGGRGGGRPDFAQGGVPDASKLGDVLAAVIPAVRRAVEQK